MDEVIIGNQIWSKQNLNVDCFRNGDLILEAKSENEWIEANNKRKPVWCYYQFDKVNVKFGKLYNWHAIIDPRNLSPEAWRIPSDLDWIELDKFISLNCDDLSARGNKLKSKEGWRDGGNGTDDFGFNALPGGFCTRKGLFDYLNDCGNWWSSNEYNKQESWKVGLIYSNGAFVRMALNKKCGLSVRCIKNL
jgi:uncharacterized protein (TIGR02145 family)